MTEKSNPICPSVWVRSKEKKEAKETIEGKKAKETNKKPTDKDKHNFKDALHCEGCQSEIETAMGFKKSYPDCEVFLEVDKSGHLFVMAKEVVLR